MIHMVREFMPNGLPIMIDGIVVGEAVEPESIRIFPIMNNRLGYPFYGYMDPDDLGKKIASRLTTVSQAHSD
ncbi:MAG: hypothetical protein CL985_00320 [Euryarchaeota archaeon]|jgi:hypothetical protein|nr:hypothetical protein [Euryarchaeota archaeon]|tara:strand:- start:921 stop:1136 length:216 start_codon:yes stop_codon:yes gene_type:complete